jgi:hypothetical protein
VDIKQYIGPPNVEARYEILRAQVTALLQPPRAAASSNGAALPMPPPMLANDLGVSLPLLSYRQLRGVLAQPRAALATEMLVKLDVCQRLHDIALQSESAGGRLLRRAPLRCCSVFKMATRRRVLRMPLSTFLQSLPDAINDEQATVARLQQSKPPSSQQQQQQQSPQAPSHAAAAASSPISAATSSTSAMSATPAPPAANGSSFLVQQIGDVNMQ